jgi:tetratricopeptide (TPR) repeat protein
MHVHLPEPLTEDAKVRIVYNGHELTKYDYVAGTTVNLTLEPPKVRSCRVQVFLDKGGESTLLQTESFYMDDLIGAKMLIEDAAEFEKKNQNWRQRAKLNKAIKLLEKLSPGSEELADAYLQMCYVHAFGKPRKHLLVKRRQEGLAWYEKRAALHERNGDWRNLKSDLTNMGVLYARFGDYATAIAHTGRGLEIERAHPTPAEDPGYDERVASWTQHAFCLLTADKVDEAEAVIKDGLNTCGAESPNCAYLWELQAKVYTWRAKQCHNKAEQLLPPESCPL